MDKLKLQFDIIKTKLLIFMAMAGGSWIYVLKTEDKLIQYSATFLFIITSYGIINNLTKLGELEKRIENE